MNRLNTSSPQEFEVPLDYQKELITVEVPRNEEISGAR